MVWPSPLNFISKLYWEAKALLEAALTDANRVREEKILKGTKYSQLSPHLHLQSRIWNQCLNMASWNEAARPVAIRLSPVARSAQKCLAADRSGPALHLRLHHPRGRGCRRMEVASCYRVVGAAVPQPFCTEYSGGFVTTSGSKWRSTGLVMAAKKVAEGENKKMEHTSTLWISRKCLLHPSRLRLPPNGSRLMLPRLLHAAVPLPAPQAVGVAVPQPFCTESSGGLVTQLASKWRSRGPVMAAKKAAEALRGAMTLRTKALKEVCNVAAMISLEKDVMGAAVGWRFSYSDRLQMEDMAFFFAELALMQYRYGLVTRLPSLVATSVVYAVRLTLARAPLWTDALKHHTVVY
ncbi:hypothetical protein ZEAMMB73_Zm00001d018753 [Zea mays]|uniref:Cyclin C-terminal domain-containing protein n=1 Tax=Zea mays TaxID=4577 RepID=A0A1D6HRX8_MAIZE|nr:hypothetical protein ZEAMMB73_Zm00001d018753 [Zea mays]